MPVSSFTNGIAQANSNPAAKGQDKPWQSMVLDTDYGAKTSTNDYRPGMFSGAAPTDGTASEGGDVWYSGGSQGAGWYRNQTDQEQGLAAQQYYGKEFRNNIPQTENTLYSQLSSSANSNMNAGIKGVQQNNSSRGLLYGGVNAGQEQGVRAQTSGLLAQGRSSINAGVEDAANKMDASAINNGLVVQQQQQQIQNDIYAQALAKMNGAGAMVGNVLGAAGAVVGTIYGGGFGGAAGYQAGQSAGKALA